MRLVGVKHFRKFLSRFTFHVFSALWTGWGGPLDADNMTIGEGPGTRNDIVIGGVLFERGIGNHAAAKIVYPLTAENWVKFEGYVGMADEKDPAECGSGGSVVFVFSVDGKEMFKSDVLKGSDGGKNVAPANNLRQKKSR